MINPNDHTAKALEYVAEHLQEWPEGADFVHVDGTTIYNVKGGSAASISYISREQWAAAKVLYRHWFPEKQPPSETACKVCGEEHCKWEAAPGICGEYESGNVSLSAAKEIHAGIHGNDGGALGIKYDTDKPMMDLIPPHMELEVAKVLTVGAQKYSANNWRHVPDLRRRYIAAAKRHINALSRGESHDDETGLHHAAHAVCCLMFLGEVEIESGATQSGLS